MESGGVKRDRNLSCFGETGGNPQEANSIVTAVLRSEESVTDNSRGKCLLLIRENGRLKDVFWYNLRRGRRGGGGGGGGGAAGGGRWGWGGAGERIAWRAKKKKSVLRSEFYRSRNEGSRRWVR